MSSNRKNRIGPTFLMNFTKNIEARHLVIENATAINGDLQKSINIINETANTIIQSLNVNIADRQLPYITLTVSYNSNLDNQARFFVHDSDTSDAFETAVGAHIDCIGTDISHMIDVLVAAGYKDIVISSLGYDAEIVVSQDFFKCAIVDVLLDIVMFNSYSFLRNLSLQEKHDFSFKKYQFYRVNALNCFYSCKTNKELYYSFAFSARKNEDEFDIERYINLWNQFIQYNYGTQIHKEVSIPRQLKHHADYGELPPALAKRFNKRAKGAYLIMRTNKDRTKDLELFICSVFGIKEYEKGKIKIVPIEEFEKYKPLFKNLDVSAFKVVKT